MLLLSKCPSKTLSTRKGTVDIARERRRRSDVNEASFTTAGYDTTEVYWLIF
jgi:hypothetical protein